MDLVGFGLRSDLQIIDSGATALDVLALVLKQLASLGVPGPHNIAKMSRYLDVFWYFVIQYTTV